MNLFLEKLKKLEGQRYAIVPSVVSDLRNVAIINNDDVKNIYEFNEACSFNYYLNDLIEKIGECILSTKEKNFPIDGIRVSGDPGLIIKSQKHQELLKRFMEEVYSINYVYHDMDYPFANWNKCTKNWRNYSSTPITNLKVEDLLYNYVPFDWKIDAYCLINDKKVITNEFLGLDRDDSFDLSFVVLLNEFIKSAREKGLSLKLNDYEQFINYELKSYEDYLECMRKLNRSDSYLFMDIDLESYSRLK
ncbi:MAG: hypothetical protein J6X02_05990 [Bacilli bacterium]|nr:hypothetical protein [Bacilli bacterium]